MEKDPPAQCIVAFLRNHVHPPGFARIHLAFTCTCFFFRYTFSLPLTTTEHNFERVVVRTYIHTPTHIYSESNGVLFCTIKYTYTTEPTRRTSSPPVLPADRFPPSYGPHTRGVFQDCRGIHLSGRYRISLSYFRSDCLIAGVATTLVVYVSDGHQRWENSAVVFDFPRCNVGGGVSVLSAPLACNRRILFYPESLCGSGDVVGCNKTVQFCSYDSITPVLPSTFKFMSRSSCVNLS